MEKEMTNLCSEEIFLAHLVTEVKMALIFPHRQCQVILMEPGWGYGEKQTSLCSRFSNSCLEEVFQAPSVAEEKNRDSYRRPEGGMQKKITTLRSRFIYFASSPLLKGTERIQSARSLKNKDDISPVTSLTDPSWIQGSREALHNHGCINRI